MQDFGRFKILVFQNLLFKILGDFTMLAFENPQYDIFTDFKTLAYFKILAFQNP